MAIVGVGGYVPEDVWSNQRLTERVPDTTDAWIRERTGIEERRFAYGDWATSDLAVLAAERALQSADIASADIDLIIVATSTPDYQLPSCASIVQHKLQAPACTAFDVNATCSGFLHALDVARRFVSHDPQYRYALVIGADMYSRILDWSDRRTAVLFGDGAGAVVVSTSGVAPSDAPRMKRSWFMTDGSQYSSIIVPGGGSREPDAERVFRMNGRVVKDFAIEKFEQTVRELCSHEGIDASSLSHVVPHQANLRIIETAMQRLHIPSHKVTIQVNRYGNTAAASVPLALTEWWNKVHKMKGPVALVSFGGGLSWGGMLIEWEPK